MLFSNCEKVAPYTDTWTRFKLWRCFTNRTDHVQIIPAVHHLDLLGQVDHIHA